MTTNDQDLRTALEPAQVREALQAADLLRRQARVFRAPAGDVPGEAQTTPDSTAQVDGTSQEGAR